MIDAKERFWSKVDKGCSCWEWLAGKFPSGYGAFFLYGRTERAHVASYKLFVGEVLDGYEVHHICENRACVNPDHLKSLTHLQHKNEHYGGSETEFPCGHERQEKNLYAKSRCRICFKKYKQEWYEANKDEILAKQQEYYLRKTK